MQKLSLLGLRDQSVNATPQLMGAIRSGDMGQAAAMNAAIGGHTMPAMAASGDKGQTFNRYSGEQIEAGALPEYQNSLGAQFVKDMAASKASQALARQRQYLNAGGDVYQIGQDGVTLAHQDPTDFVSNVASAKPTTAMQKQTELEAQGIPSPVARGIAYGTIRMTTGELGLSKELVDTMSGQTIGVFEQDGLKLTPAGEGMYRRPMSTESQIFVNPKTGVRVKWRGKELVNVDTGQIIGSLKHGKLEMLPEFSEEH